MGIPVFGQAEEEAVYIDAISIVGNKRTKASIIHRELLIASGDTVLLVELPQKLERSEELIMNTGLFNRVQISFDKWEGSTNRIALIIQVEEAWYLFPVPVFELADRNFNVWWVEQGRSIQRTNIGLDFAHINVSGRQDKLKFSAKYGYTRKYSIFYEMPYINRQQTIGLYTETALLRNRELNYRTEDNKQLFYHDENQFVYQRFRTDLGLIYRPRIRSIHRLSLGFRNNKVDETIATDLNPQFFLDGRSKQRFFSLNYRFRYEKLDVRAYPWRGKMYAALISKDGLGIYSDRNDLDVTLEYREYIPMGARWSFGMEVKTKFALIRRQQPYNDNRALGFGNNYLRGFEYYIIDGQDMGLFKSSMRLELFNTQLNYGKLMPLEALRQMPLRLNLSFNNDLGYVNSPFSDDFNPMNNRMLWGGGIGLDIIVYYNKIIQIEYSFNDLLENGLFLHLNMNI
jgi:outer membrane protein assembly factor BamA